MPKRGENIHKRKDGRWEGRYKKNKTPSEKSIYGSVYGHTYREVKEKLRNINQNKVEENQSKNSELSFRDLLFLWMETNHLKHKGATEAKYEYLIEKHILPCLGDYKLSDINTLILNKFAEEKLRSGRLDKKGGLSSSYVRSIMIIVISALKYAADEKMCMPLKTSVYKPSSDKKKLVILSFNEQQKLESQLLGDTDQTKLVVLISLHTGLRIGEVCALSWDDIDLETQIIHVRSTVTRIKGDTMGSSVLIIDKPKTKSSLRDIPIPSKLLSVLKYMKSQSNSKYVISKNALFLSPRTYEYRFHKLLENCHIKQLNYHALRHTFATRCIEVGVDVKTLSEILGHANVSITLNTYVHPSMELKRSQLEKLETITV